MVVVDRTKQEAQSTKTPAEMQLFCRLIPDDQDSNHPPIFTRNPMKHLILLLFLTCWLPALPFAQSSLLDTERIRSRLFEGAKNKKTGVTTNAPQRQIVNGVVSRVADSESIWLRIDDRGEFRKWTYQLSKSSLNLSRQEIRVYLQYVSPKLSINRGKEYNAWFQKKVAFELGKSFSGRSVRVEYELQEELYRLNGIVLSGDTNINLWMVQNGWSFYLLTEGVNPDEPQFLAAEAMARNKKVGLWDEKLQGSTNQ